jgi:hypothetical protein
LRGTAGLLREGIRLKGRSANFHLKSGAEANAIWLIAQGDTVDGERSMFSKKRLAAVGLAIATIAGSTLAVTDTANARGWGHGGYYHGGGFRGRGFGIGAGLATGLAIGALGAGYGYGYGYGPGYGAYAYDDEFYGGDCVLRRRVHYTPYGPVVRHVRVCYKELYEDV